MSKRKTEINPIRAKRVKYIYDDQGLTQAQFAERIGMSQQNVSKIVNMKIPLTDTIAQVIINEFPQYRLAWLWGVDNFPTEPDRIRAFFKTLQDEGHQMTNCIITLARLKRFDVQDPNNSKNQTIEDFFKSFETAITFTRDGKTVTLSLAELNDLENDILDYFEMRLSRLLG